MQMMSSLWKALQFITDRMKMVGAACLFGMVALTCVDVVGRYFKHPLFGSVELVTFLGVLAVAMALPFTHETKGHIGVELFVRRLPRKSRGVIDLATGIMTLGLFALVTWRMLVYAFKMMRSGEVSMNLELPEYAIIFVVACCFVVFTLAIVKSIARTVEELRKK